MFESLCNTLPFYILCFHLYLYLFCICICKTYVCFCFCIPARRCQLCQSIAAPLNLVIKIMLMTILIENFDNVINMKSNASVEDKKMKSHRFSTNEDCWHASFSCDRLQSVSHHGSVHPKLVHLVRGFWVGLVLCGIVVHWLFRVFHHFSIHAIFSYANIAFSSLHYRSFILKLLKKFNNTTVVTSILILTSNDLNWVPMDANVSLATSQ